MKSGNKMKIETCAAMLALALVTGCASTGQQPAPTQPEAAASAAPQIPLYVPAKLLNVYINDHRTVCIGARIFLA
jgi:hypothetical protein